MTNPKVILVGCGNMGCALLDGWLARGLEPNSILVVEPDATSRQRARDRDVPTLEAPDLIDAGAAPQALVLAVKPQILPSVVEPYRQHTGQTLFISVAAGTRLGSLRNLLGKGTAIVRAMPNTPAAVRNGMTVLCQSGNCTDAQHTLATELFKAVGDVAWITDEHLMDAVTAVSGSGPAYTFLLIEALRDAAKSVGLPDDLALQLAETTTAGAAWMALQSELDPETLRENVTSPGGTTEAALSILRQTPGGLPDLLQDAVAAATSRGRELSDENDD